MSYIRIQRTGDWYASGLPVSIFINGIYRGKIEPPAPNKAVDFTLPSPGKYNVFFEIDGCRSAIYETPYIAEDEFQTLEVELPDIAIFSWIFRRKNFGRLVPRSTAIAKHR